MYLFCPSSTQYLCYIWSAMNIIIHWLKKIQSLDLICNEKEVHKDFISFFWIFDLLRIKWNFQVREAWVLTCESRDHNSLLPLLRNLSVKNVFEGGGAPSPNHLISDDQIHMVDEVTPDCVSIKRWMFYES